MMRREVGWWWWVCFVGILIGGTYGAPSHLNRLYASNSAWRAKLPDDAPISSSSATYVTELLRQINYTNYVWINTDGFSVPLYYVSADQSTSVVSVRGSDTFLQIKANSVPIPDGATPAAGSDSSILFYQNSTDSIWEFWQFKRNTTTGLFSASWGGYMSDVSTNPGFFKFPHPTWGTAATSIGLGGGVMSIADAQAGIFPYALRLTLQDHARGLFVPPALRTDGNGLSVVPEGTRYRLPADFDLSTITNSFARIVATALRDYGMITSDTSGGVVLYAEDPTQYGTNVWPSIWGDPYPSNVLQYIPWNLMQVVDPIWQPWNSLNPWYQLGDVTGPTSYNVSKSFAVYTDSLASGWLDYSWATVNKSNTNPVYSGSYSISATFSGSSGFYLHTTSGIDTTNYNAIQMWVLPSATSVDLLQQQCLSIIQLVNGSSALGGAARLGSLFTYGMPSEWTQITILFSDMAWTPGTPIQGFWIQGQMLIPGSSTLYIDDISLVKLDPIYSTTTTTASTASTATTSNGSGTTSTASGTTGSGSTTDGATTASGTTTTGEITSGSGRYTIISQCVLLVIVLVLACVV